MWKWQTQTKNRRGGDACFCLVTHQLADICAVSFALKRGWLWSRAGLDQRALWRDLLYTQKWQNLPGTLNVFQRCTEERMWWLSEVNEVQTVGICHSYITVYMKETMRSLKKAKKMLKSLLQRALPAFLFSKLRWTCSKLKYINAPILTYGWPLHFGSKNNFINPTQGIHSIIKMNTAAQERVVW